MTPLVIPERVQHILRHPALDERAFTPTHFTPAATKAWFGTRMLHFMASGYPQHQFTQRLYNQLMHCWGFCAEYDKGGFWAEHFASTRGRISFTEQVAIHPGWGSPDHTFCDVEREVSRRVRAANLYVLLINHLCQERDAADRAEYARLQAKFACAAPQLEPVRTVYVPVPAPSPPRAPRRDGDAGQLALGLGYAHRSLGRLPGQRTTQHQARCP